MALKQTALFRVRKNILVKFESILAENFGRNSFGLGRKELFNGGISAERLLSSKIPITNFWKKLAYFGKKDKDVHARSDNLEFLVGNPTFLTLSSRYTEMYEIVHAKLQ